MANKKIHPGKKYFVPILFCALILVFGVYAFRHALKFSTISYDSRVAASSTPANTPVPVLDILAYNTKMITLANYGTSTLATSISATSSAWTLADSSISSPKHRWPVKTVYPNAGALLPFGRIVAYYGNFYSTQMGILGQYPVPQMLEKFQVALDEWQAADPTTPVIPAIDYIAVTAQASAGADGKYRLRMPADQIKKAIALADQVHGIVFIDIQPGLSTLQTEIPLFEQYLKMPEVELALDPEFSMKTGAKPGTIVGTMDATDINYAAQYLANIVKANNLPPKILLVHRFTDPMVTNYKNITPLPEVQIVMNMDGWGPVSRKTKTYIDAIQVEPVQFAGIKLFYKNDLRPPSTALLTPAQILKLKPQPSFIEYQ